MKYSENNSLVIKVFKSLFVQIMDGLNFGHIYDDCMAIWKWISTSRRVFITVSFSPAFKEKRKACIESFDNCNTVSLNWSSLSFSLPACFKLSLNYKLTGYLRSWLFINMSTVYYSNMLFLATWITFTFNLPPSYYKPRKNYISISMVTREVSCRSKSRSF